jgi:ferric-dicitrate binding protein FerR (iron transport regulator)
MNDNERDPIATLVRLAGRRPEVAAGRTARVKAAVAEEWRTTIRRRRRVRIGVAAAVAAVAASFAGILLVRSQPEATIPAAAPMVAHVLTIQGPSGLAAGQALRAGAQIDLPANGFASLEWNGATLLIDGGTHLRLESRDVATLQRGAVYYAGDAAVPGVTLHTVFGDIRDVGTRFEVRLRDDAVRVRVRDGAVEVRGTTARARTELVATRTGITERPVSTSGDEWAWIERAAPPLLLEGKTLETVLRKVAEEKGLTLEWNGARDVRGVVLRGTMPLSAAEALDAATAAAGVAYRIEGDRLIVGDRP